MKINAAVNGPDHVVPSAPGDTWHYKHKAPPFLEGLRETIRDGQQNNPVETPGDCTGHASVSRS